MPDLTKLSASRVGMLVDRCPKQFEFRYVDGIISPPGHALVLGGAVHKGAEVENLSKIALGESADPEAVLDAYSDEWDERARNENGPEVEWEDQDPGKLKDLGVTMTRTYLSELSPQIKPVSAEREFLLPIPGSGYRLHGFIDVEDEYGRQRDLKTAGRLKSQASVARDTQGSVYAYAAELEGKPAKGFVLDVVTKASTPKTQSIEPEGVSARAGELRVRAAIDMIEKGSFPPHFGGWWCSQKFCGWWKICPHGGG